MDETRFMTTIPKTWHEKRRGWSAAFRSRYDAEARRVYDVAYIYSREDDREELFIKTAMRLGVSKDIIKAMRAKCGLDSDSEDGRRFDNDPHMRRSITFARVCDAATGGHRPTKEQWPSFLATAERMGVGKEIRAWGRKNGIAADGSFEDETTKSTNYEFVSRLVGQIGKTKFTEAVCGSGGTPRDAQNLLGALQYGADRFDSKADLSVVKKLSELEID